MVDTPTKEQLDALNQEIKETADAVGAQYSDAFTSFFGKIAQGAQNAGRAMETLGDIVTTTAKSLTVMGASADFRTLQEPLDKVLDTFGKLTTVVDGASFFKQFSDDSVTAINTVTGNLDLVKKAMIALGVPAAEVTTKMAANFIANANEGEKLENSFIALSAAGGDMSKVFKGQGGDLQDLTALTTAYSNTVSNAADVTGLSIRKSQDFADALLKIPGALNETIKTGDHAEDSTSSLITTMALMTGTGQSQSTVIGTLTKAYEDLGQAQGTVNDSAQKGSELLATISSVSTGLKLRFEDVKTAMEGVADQFKFIGNETDATARVLGRYTDALRATGLTSKASIDITSEMISNIEKMTVGTKAFLSLRSGGPGGLQGAFQIDKMLREGKLDQVTQLAEKSLKQQFGGKIYTQEEASQSQEGAAGFMRQRQLLQSGSFGIGKGMDDAKATRLLEALGKGDTLAATKEIKTGQDALKSVTKQGADIQERNNNELKVMNRGVERAAIAGEITALAMTRGTVGALGAAKTDLRQQVQMGRSLGERQDNNRQDIERHGTKPMDAQEQMSVLRRQMANNLLQSAKGTAGAIPAAVTGGKDIAREALSGINSIVKNINVGSEQNKNRIYPAMGQQPVQKPQTIQHAQPHTPRMVQKEQDANKGAVLSHALKTAMQTHPTPVTHKMQQESAAHPAAGAITHRDGQQVIKLVVQLDKGLVSHQPAGNSIGHNNAASAGIASTSSGNSTTYTINLK